jgi:glycine/D-amino acid oxidase-like deaminating enzyme
MSRWDVVIVGGGIVGTASALWLSRAGFKVLLLERWALGCGATAEGMGHIMAAVDSPDLAQLTAYSQSLWKELQPSMPADCEWRSTGTFWAALDSDEMTVAESLSKEYENLGLPAEIWSGSEARQHEPILGERIAGGLHAPDDAVIYTTNACRWLADMAVKEGAEIRFAEVSFVAKNLVGLKGGEQMTADHVVVCAGARSPDLIENLMVEPRRGHLVITDRVSTPVHRQIIELGYLRKSHGMEGSSVALNVQPRATGQLLIGSSREFQGWSREIDHKTVSEMMKLTINYMPELARVSAMRIWTGFRPSVPDGKPIIGEHSSGVWVNAGHEGLGITNAVGSASILTSLMTEKRPQITAKAFDAGRLIHGRSKG